MFRYNCLLFDLDGTLLDFKKGEEDALQDTFAHFSIPQTEDAYARYERINAALWRSYEQKEIKKEKLVTVRFSMLLTQLEMEGNAKEINDYYFSKLAENGYAYPGVLEMFEALEDGATLAIVTNGSSAVQAGRLKESGLAPFIDELVNSEDAGAAKPAKKFFTYTMEKLGVTNTAKVLVIGDSLTADIAGGNAFGLDTCWYNPQGLENDTGETPTYTVQNYDEILQLVMGDDYELYASQQKKL